MRRSESPSCRTVERTSVAGAAYHGLLARQTLGQERRAYASPTLRAVIAVSRRTATELTTHYDVPPDRISVVHNGVDLDAFDAARYPDARMALRDQLRLPPDALMALLVGTYARKGLATAIAAVARASPSLHLAVAGAGSEADARRWAAASGMDARLHLLGPRADVAPLYAAADLLILPTRYEPFGMVIAEAMASGLPVVVSARAGAAEIIRDGESGRLVEEPDDTEGFARAVRAILADPECAQAMGRAARAAARAVAWPRIVERTEEVLFRAAGVA